jgi:hypothetical protein
VKWLGREKCDFWLVSYMVVDVRCHVFLLFVTSSFLGSSVCNFSATATKGRVRLR